MLYSACLLSQKVIGTVRNFAALGMVALHHTRVRSVHPADYYSKKVQETQRQKWHWDRCRSKQISEVRRIFVQIFPNLSKKLSCNVCRLFFSFDQDKLVFICFSANFGRHFSKSNTVGRHFVSRFSEILPRYFEILFGFSGILPKFSGIVPGFQQFKTFGGVFAPHAPPPPKPLDTGEARCENETYFLPKNRKRFYFNNKERQHLKYSRNTNLVQWNFRNW